MILADRGSRLGLEHLGPNVGLLLDAWHWYTSPGTVEELHTLANDDVVYVHATDAPSGVPIEQQQDMVRRLTAATGVIDLPAFYAALRTVGYDGPVVPEPFVPELKTVEPAGAVIRVKEAMDVDWDSTPNEPLPENMKVVVTGDGKAWRAVFGVPRPEGNQVVIKLHTAPNCGSNLGAFRNEGEYTNVGHDGVGEVVAVAHSILLKVGGRVALALLNSCGVCKHCLEGNGSYCENRPEFYGNFAGYTKISDTLCAALPDDIDYDRGSLLGCGLGRAYRAIRTLGIAAPDTVIVAGLGPVGLCAVVLATFHGAEVIALDPEGHRRGLAGKLGVAETFNPLQSDVKERLAHATRGERLPLGIECSGKASSQRLLLDMAAIGARIAIVGENQGEILVSPSRDFIRKRLTLVGCWHMNVLDAPRLFSFLRRAPQKAFDVFGSGKSSKVLLKPYQ